MTRPDDLDPMPHASAERHAPALSSRFIAIAVMVTLVLVSALAGAAIDRTLVHGRPGFDQHGPGGPGGRGPGGPGRGGPGGAGPLDQTLTGDLALTPAQRSAIDSAMAVQFREFETARSSVQPRIDSILKVTRERIDAILTPAQRAALPKFPEGRDGDGRGPGRGNGRGPGFGPPHDRRDGGPPRNGGRGKPPR